MNNDKLKTHSLFYLISKISSSLFTYIAIIFFIRIAGAEEYGKYALVFSLILFTITFSSGWINQTILRFKFDKIRYYLPFFFAVSLIPGLIILASLIISSPGLPISVLLLSLVLYLLGFIYSTKLTLLQAETKVFDYTIQEVLRTLLLFLIPLFIYLYTDSLDYIKILLGILLGYLIALLVKKPYKFPFIRYNAEKFSWDERKKALTVYLKFGIPIGMWLGAAYLLNVIDRFFIAHLDNYTNAGIYSAAYDIIYKSFSVIYVPILNAAHPLIMNSWDKDKHESLVYLRRSIKYEILVFPVIIIAILFVSPVLAHVMKIDHTVFRNLIIPISIGSFLWHVSMLLHKPLELGNKTFLMLIFVLIALVSNIIGNIFFIPIYGYFAAAYTTIASAIVYISLVTYYINYRK